MTWVLSAVVLAATMVMGALVLRRSVRARRWWAARGVWLDNVGQYRQPAGRGQRWRP